MRMGPELVRASSPYAREERGRSWSLLAITLAVYGSFVAMAAAAPIWPLRLLGSVLAGLTIVRLFIFFHDYAHGAILQSRAGKAVMPLIGYWTLSAPSVWRQTHDYHHKNTAKIVGASIGSYPIVTVDMWRLMTPGQRRDYRLVRHPLNMMFGYVTVFILGMCGAAFLRAPRVHWHGLLSLVIHFGIMGLVGALYGADVAVFAVLIPQFLASGLGSYLFYAQHNFPSMQLRGRRDWEYSFAALHSSSMFDMGPVLHWFTGNIGYHHVHHLNHRIPFYRLPEAMAALPELQDPGRTSWRPSDVMACLRLKVWDPAKGRMVSFEEADATPQHVEELLSAK
ncbi:MAG: fatty acid desaturase [Pseudomonadota bacterium]|nr:fatty acid desaturase [Pseudomonadota bacterium]